MRLVLSGLDGTNPLGFLAALGALVTADARWPHAQPCLGWTVDDWTAVLEVERELTRDGLAQELSDGLHRDAPSNPAAVEATKRAYDHAKRDLKRAYQALKARRLPRADRLVALAVEIQPLKEQEERRRRQWRQALRDNAPDPVVSLGSDLTVTSGEFREFCLDAQSAATPGNRRLADYGAAYGATTADADERIRATPLALLNGSGHQHFLGSAAELMVDCSAAHIEEALFGPWQYRDEKYSLRLDPREDRRYALMAVDPTASSNKPRTVWGANRLAFEALRLFPVIGGQRNARTVCVTGSRRDGVRFCWPLWERPLSLDVVRTLLASGVPDGPEAATAHAWRLRGIAGVWSSERMAVGSGANAKYNLTPSVVCWR